MMLDWRLIKGLLITHNLEITGKKCFVPYFLVVGVHGQKITVLSCMGGPNSYDRKHEPNAKIDNFDNTWSFDVSKSITVNKDWISKAVKYDSTPGFVADVINTEKTKSIVQEWIRYRVKSIQQQLNELGPEASAYLLEQDAQNA